MRIGIAIVTKRVADLMALLPSNIATALDIGAGTVSFPGS